MPSVMDMIKWRDKWIRMTPQLRNQVITDMIAWLESDERPKCKAEHLSHLIQFETELQSLLNQNVLSERWFLQAAQTHGAFPFYAAFMRRAL